jgi:hypothetical protein
MQPEFQGQNLLSALNIVRQLYIIRCTLASQFDEIISEQDGRGNIHFLDDKYHGKAQGRGV